MVQIEILTIFDHQLSGGMRRMRRAVVMVPVMGSRTKRLIVLYSKQGYMSTGGGLATIIDSRRRMAMRQHCQPF